MPLNISPNTQTALLEAGKEVLRWVVFFAISWVITETLKQIDLVPEFATVKVWVFTYLLPVRSMVQFGLTFLGRAADKFVHEWNATKLRGILPF